MASKSKPPKPPERPPTLTSDQGAQLLRRQYEKGKQLLENRPISQADERAWKTSAQEALENAFGSAAPNVRTFCDVGLWDAYGTTDGEPEWEQNRAERTGERLKIIEGLIELLETKTQILSGLASVPSPSDFGSRVFLVHGHAEAITHEVARFLERLDLDVIVLREQPNQGNTIIEKFIDYSNVGFAVVLLTGDDRGGTVDTEFKDQKPRARQNVILELGFFLGKLGRPRVCALYQEGVEIPSDYSGVLFVPFDPSGGWGLSLAREMKAAGLDVDMNRAL